MIFDISINCRRETGAVLSIFPISMLTQRPITKSPLGLLSTQSGVIPKNVASIVLPVRKHVER